MTSIQQSIDIKAPAYAAYRQLTRFEDYPRFMEEVRAVRRLDDTHLHWTTTISNRTVDWDAEITEQEAGRCIAWRNVSGPTNAGKVEVQPAGDDASRVVMMLESEPEQVPGSKAGNSEEAMERRLKLDLARLKELIEGHADAGARATGERPKSLQKDRSTQSDYSLSQSFGNSADGSSSVSEEISLDQQSDAVRHVGQMPQDTSNERGDGLSISDAMGKALQKNQPGGKGDAS